MKIAPSLDIDGNRAFLNRCRFVKHRSMRILAGWLPQVAWFELKCEVGRSVWENAQHVNAFYLRLREIQSPAFQDPADPALVRLMDEMLHAPDEWSLAVAIYRVLGPSFVQALEAHRQSTFLNSDFPSIYAIDHMLVDQRAELLRLQPILEQAEKAGRFGPQAGEWEKYIRKLLAAAGGVSGLAPRPHERIAVPAGRKEFSAPTEAARDERFTNLFADLKQMPDEANYERFTLVEFERYSTEMLAAETVALVMFHSPAMPWEFQMDAARHLYDEVRHCLMGYEWMRRHDLDPFHSPQYLQIFKWRSQFSAPMQYCFLTMGNEVHSFPHRQRRIDAHKTSGEFLSEQFVRYDMADETQHVRFGHRWLPELLKQSGETKSCEQYIEAAMEIWRAEYQTGKLSVLVE